MTPKEQQRQSRVVWFEIPAWDLNRAVAFYSWILELELKVEMFGPVKLAVFPYPPTAISGCITEGGTHQPGVGPLIFLNADPVLDRALGRVEEAGGKLVLPKVALPNDMGVYAHIEDTEGNVVGLHAIS
jgi:predicted enzyme related to lactoylglutathione lyase